MDYKSWVRKLFTLHGRWELHVKYTVGRLIWQMSLVAAFVSSLRLNVQPPRVTAPRWKVFHSELRNAHPTSCNKSRVRNCILYIRQFDPNGETTGKEGHYACVYWNYWKVQHLDYNCNQQQFIKAMSFVVHSIDSGMLSSPLTKVAPQRPSDWDFILQHIWASDSVCELL